MTTTPPPALPSQEYQPVPQPPQRGSNGIAIAALIFGILTLVICLIPIVNNGAYFTGLIGLVLGIIGIRRAKKVLAGRGMSLAAIICSALGIIGAIISTIVYVTVLNGVGDAIEKGNVKVKSAPSVSSSSSSATTDDTTPADDDATDDEDSGPSTFALGDTATITQGDEDSLKLTITSVVVHKTASDEYGEKPKNGRYKIVSLKATHIAGTDSFDLNPFDFYFVGKDGEKFEYGDGNYSGYDSKDFADSLTGSQKTSGTIEFDVPSSARQLIYAPSFSGEPLAMWKTK